MIFNATTPSSGGGGSSFEGFRKVDTWDEFHGLLDGADTGTAMILLYNMYMESCLCMVNGASDVDALLVSPPESWPFCVNSDTNVTRYEYLAYSEFDRHGNRVFFTLEAGTGDEFSTISIFLDGDIHPDYTAEYYIKTS